MVVWEASKNVYNNNNNINNNNNNNNITITITITITIMIIIKILFIENITKLLFLRQLCVSYDVLSCQMT